MALRLRLWLILLVAMVPVLFAINVAGYSLASERLNNELDVRARTGSQQVATLLATSNEQAIEHQLAMWNAVIAGDYQFQVIVFEEGARYALYETAAGLFDTPISETAPAQVTSRQSVDGVEYNVAYAPIEGDRDDTVGYVIGAVSRESTDRLLNDLRLVLIAGTGLVLAATSLPFLGLSSLALRPIHRLARAASDIERTADFSKRLPRHAGLGDITELAGSMNALISRVEEVLHSQQGFMAYSSHELRRPLTVIRTNIDVLEGPNLGEEDRLSTLKEIRLETDVIARLTSDLMLIARERRLLERSEVDLSEICSRVFARCGDRDPRRIYGFAGVGPAIVFGDPIQIEQMVLNLVENAAQNTQPGGRIQIKLTRAKKSIEVSITDNGAGIPEDEQPHIFERWFRGRTARRDRSEGTGLGLFIVQLIVESHGGRVGFQSQEGVGSVFVIELPLVR